ncbi:type II secretion system F family protein [Patescibacteria group bacterium]|nr:type II secretion system F family protein [Patescibacteria group bacterium]
MPLFSYTAKSVNGETKAGSQEAASETELAHSLREQGFLLTSLRAISGQALPSRQRLKEFLPSFAFIPLSEKMLFARHLAIMIGAGLAMTRALEILSLQTKNKNFAKILFTIKEDINRGQPLADAINKYPKIFSELFVNMVRVGETSGSLEETLKMLAYQMEKEYELKSKVRSAMIYPIIIIIAMFGIGLLMMIVVVPKLTLIFKEMNTDLPLTTQMLIGLSNFLSQHWLIGLWGLAALLVAGRFIIKTQTGKTYIDWLILRLPTIGEIVKKINSARLARTLGALVESNVPIVQSLQIIAGTLGNSFFRRSLSEAAATIQKGGQLSKFIDTYPQLYPPMVGQMIAVGEETGTLGTILGKLADFYEEEVANVTKGIATIIEPVLMVVIGAAVGFFAISMIQPMYSLMQGM